MLYASSSIDAAKFQMLSKSFNEVFTGGTGVLDYSSVTPPENESDGIDEVKKEKEEKEKNKKEKEKAADQEELKNVKSRWKNSSKIKSWNISLRRR
ncbi:hypothetical protein QO179_03925 [Bacillus stercoris]|nr:hypothetical protein [Bacillus stercoris]